MSAALRDGHRPRGPRAAPDATQDVLRLRRRPSARRPITQTCPVCQGMPGVAAGHQPARHRVRRPTACALGCAVNAREPLRAEALLLPGHAEELPDQPVRGAAGRARLARDRASTARRARHRRSSACTSRRTWASSSTRAAARDGEREPGGLQPRRRAADGDRLATRSPVARRRPPRTCGALRAILGLPRRLRREHGGGLAPLRRQRVAPAARGDRARHEGRDQEHELLPQRARRPRVRGRAPGARARRGRAASSRRRGCGTPTGTSPSRCARRSTRTTTATSPSPTCRPLELEPGLGRRDRARRCPSCPRARRARFVEAYGLPPTTRSS